MSDWRPWISALSLAGLIVGCNGDEPADGGDSDGGTTTGDDGVDSGSDDGVPLCGDASVGLTPLRRLTRQQYANAVRDLLGLSADITTLDGDEKVGPFDSNVSAPISPVQISQYRAIAENVALTAVSDVEAFLPCAPADDGCLSSFVESFGRRAFRRPLTDAEVSMYASMAAPTDPFEDGVRLAIQAMLQSPYFLYHLEVSLPDPDAGPVIALNDFELAARLSFFLWDSVPDDDLLDAAEQGDLDDPTVLREQAERLLLDPRAREAVAAFHEQWLGLDELEHMSKDPSVYPLFDDELREAMINETRRFTSTVVLSGDGSLETLLTAPYSYIEGPLYELYGVTPGDEGIGDPVALPESERAGLLTQASFLAAHAHANQSGPIHRGVTVRTNLLCTPPPPPPPDVNAIPPDPDPDATTREIFEIHTANEACEGCHVLIDGIGLGFEGYDGIGAYRTMEHGLPVDQTGVLTATDVDGEFEGAVELAHMLADSQQVRECVSLQWFRYAFGRVETEEDSCSLEVLDYTFEASDYNIRELLLALIETDAFRYRLAQ